MSDESCFLPGPCAANNVGSSCDGGVVTPCSTEPIDCDDGIACTDDTCDGVVGCVNAPVDCDDGNACTADSCDAANGTCLNDSIDCDDGSACTTDSCDPADGCVNDPVDCDDGDECTADSCDLALGCVNDSVDCDDGDECTDDSCDPASGCLNDLVDCDDGEECTIDSCDPTSGCVNEAIDCDDGDACTADSCDLGVCSNESIDCNDGNACTTDSCDPASGCLNEAVACDDGDECTADFCSLSFGCQNEPIEGCDEGDDGGETEPLPPGGGPPPIILTDSGAADAQGNFAADAVAGNGELRAEVAISGAAPGTEFELVLTEGTPTDDGLLPGGTITGFAANGARLPRTLRIETNNFGGFFIAKVAMYFTDEELAARGISRGDATDIELHTLPTFGGQSWTPAGNNVGNRMPPEGEDALMAALGQSGFFFDDENGRWCYWAIVNHFSTFAVGEAEVAQVADLPDDEPSDDGDDVVVDPGDAPDDGDTTPPPADEPPGSDQTPPDEDGDGIADVRDLCPGTEPGTETDSFGCPLEAPPTQTEPPQGNQCGAGIAPCGMMGMLGLWGMFGGLGLLKFARPRVHRR